MSTKPQYVDVVKDLAKNIGFILGFRRNYKVENLLTLLAIVAFVISYFYVWGNSIYTAIVTGAILLGPATLQYLNYRRRVMYLPKEMRTRVPPPSVPLFTIIVSTVLSGFLPPLIIVAIINTTFIEDVTVFLSEVDVVKMKRELKILFEPIAKRELFVLFASTTVSAIVAYIVSHNLLVFVYPAIAYIMLVYSLILVPPEYRPPEARTPNILEEISRRVPFLFFLFMQYYQAPSRIRLGKEAGMVGASYYTFIRKMAGLFTLSLYTSLAVTPLLYIFIGNIAFATPVVIALLMFFVPQISFTFKRNSRASKINRNLMLILSYLAAMASVAEDFTSAMQNLKFTPALAKMFGLEEEANIYLNIYRAKNTPDVAMEDYADTIPDDFYRDTVRAIKDISENEGYGAVFRALVARLRDYTTRHIDRVATTFESIGSNIISVIILLETTIPIMLFLSNPTLMPIMMLLGGILSAFMISAIASMTLPDLPSEFIHTKPRYRRGALIFVLTATFLTVLESVLLPDLLKVLVPLNVVPAFFATLWYVSYEDMALNNDFLNKFPDLLILFSSSMIRQNNVEKALLDLSQQGTFSRRMRNTFQKLANIFAVLTAERLSYKGPYWYKYFMFLASISAKYGTTPRELYKTISDFMLEYKKFFSMVSSFGRSILFMTFIALVVMNVEIVITVNFLHVMSSLQISKVTSQFGMQTPLPELTPEQLSQMEFMSYLALLVTAIMNGVAVSKTITGTFRDGKWVLIMYVAQILLLYFGITTSFGIKFGVGQTPGAPVPHTPGVGGP